MTLTDPRKLRNDELIRDMKIAVRSAGTERDPAERRREWKRVSELFDEVERRLTAREPYGK